MPSEVKQSTGTYMLPYSIMQRHRSSVQLWARHLPSHQVLQKAPDQSSTLPFSLTTGPCLMSHSASSSPSLSEPSPYVGALENINALTLGGNRRGVHHSSSSSSTSYSFPSSSSSASSSVPSRSPSPSCSESPFWELSSV